ncbi:TraB/GumN family protein [Novosphingobium sp. KCTC 2891]|uniref:TraB/GumN family protein n=1 Tax=Novosphingobium sp. KCTC 2891 TaxID=2989730 RepID=UPI0022228CF6|nr:TraB/GumN family protein [Novosphingobium sp. KCTC 2891]MCW1381838.1 TraB/GumN family protein [Novosphingobium sp. KCTC 2891]
MKRTIRLIALLALTVAAPLQAQPSPQPPAPATAQAPTLRPALWKVADADTTIWLFGTVHVLRPGLDWYGGPVAAALEGADEVVTEALDPSGLAAQQAAISRAMLPKGKRLRVLMKPAQRSAFETLLRREGLPVDALDAYKPWYAALMLSTLPLARRGISPAAGAEATIAAHAAGKTQTGLETVDRQLAILDALPRTVQVRWLGEIVADFDTINTETDALFDAWGKGNAEELARLATEPDDDPVLLEALLHKRNREWAGWIARRLDRPGTVFVAVGAGHLAGAGCVQDELAKSGLATTRMQ